MPGAPWTAHLLVSSRSRSQRRGGCAVSTDVTWRTATPPATRTERP